GGGGAGVGERPGRHSPGRRRDRPFGEFSPGLPPGRGQPQDAGRGPAEEEFAGQPASVPVEFDAEAGRQGRHRASPPSTGTTAPVIAPLSGPARNARTAATSSGSRRRFIGCWTANTVASGRP